VLAHTVLIAPGFDLIHHRGTAVGELGQSRSGCCILTKMGLLAAMGIVTLMHSLGQGPRVHRTEQP